ncbi:MAG: hypothetical protein MZV70_00265 [Desulfobacterales bacterium]|nr:hypothetical protein [Desulfobacterales bacterium]
MVPGSAAIPGVCARGGRDRRGRAGRRRRGARRRRRGRGRNGDAGQGRPAVRGRQLGDDGRGATDARGGLPAAARRVVLAARRSGDRRAGVSGGGRPARRRALDRHGDRGYVVRTCENNDDGRLQHEAGAGVTGCATSYPAFLRYFARGGVGARLRVHRDAGDERLRLRATVGGVAQVAVGPLAAGGPDAAFLRADAALAVVVLTDENDCSTDDTTLFDPDGPTPLATRCVDLAGQLTPVARYVTTLSTVRPDGRYAIGFLVGVSPTLSVCNTTGDLVSLRLTDATMQERINPSTGQVQPVCENAETRATPGIRFVALAGALGRHAIVRSICEPQFERFFAQLAELVQTIH